MKSARFFTALMLQMMASGSVAIECNEGTLLQVNFNNINQTTWDEYLPGSESVKLSVQPSGNVGGSSVSNSTSFPQLFDLKDYEQCISPEDATCFAVAVTLPPDLFEIVWDGEVVPVDRVFESAINAWYPRYATSTELGQGCELTCDNGESLFDYEEWTASGASEFKLETPEGTRLLGCDKGGSSRSGQDWAEWWSGCPYIGGYRLFKYKACLPSSGCYSLFVGNKGFRHSSSYTLRYGGKVVKKSTGVMFDTIPFGSDCKSRQGCGDDESRMDLYILKDYYQIVANYSWAVNEVGRSNGIGGKPLREIVSGFASGGPNTTLHHETSCLPKDTCMSFAPNPNQSDDNRGLSYQLELDDVVYASSRYSAWSEDILIGKCSQNEACRPGEDLLDVTTRTVNERSAHSATSSKIEPWRVKDSSERKFGKLFFEGFDLNTTHRAMMAIRKSATGLSCSYVEMPAHDVASVSVELNGESLPVQRVKHSVWEGDVFSTQIDCSSAKSLEMGATVGIAVTSALALFVAFG